MIAAVDLLLLGIPRRVRFDRTNNMQTLAGINFLMYLLFYSILVFLPVLDLSGVGGGFNPPLVPLNPPSFH